MRVYLGDLGADFAWGGRFRVSEHPEENGSPERWSVLTPEALGRALERVLLAYTPATAEWPELIEAAWSIARDEGTRTALAACGSLEAERDVLRAAVERKVMRHRGAALEANETWYVPWLDAFEKQVKPVVERVAWRRRTNVIRTLGAARRPLEAFIPIFLGDVFV